MEDSDLPLVSLSSTASSRLEIARLYTPTLDPTDSNFIGFLKSVSRYYIEREAIGEKFYVSVRYKDYQLQWREEGHNMAVNNIYITGDD